MSTFTAVKTGPASDPATFSGSPATPPAAGDTVLTQGFTVYFDYSIAGAGIALNDSSSSDGYVSVCAGRNVKISGLTGGINISGSPGYLENMASGSFHAKGGY